MAEPDPADLDVKQTRNKKYQASPTIGRNLKGKYQERQASESPIFMSTTSADAMSTDEAMEISKKIDEEVEKKKQQGRIPNWTNSCAGRGWHITHCRRDTISQEWRGGCMKKLIMDTETSGIVTFHPKYREKVKRFAEIEKKENKKPKKEVGYLSPLQQTENNYWN